MPGVVKNAKDDPRLVAFATTLARARFPADRADNMIKYTQSLELARAAPAEEQARVHWSAA